ncbi:hypothetical protein CkaCkLH20_10791 [Colletotrichum karsti]|uniref:Uncharacterized protein n=1 Tax=Colletotrichum karsti TaxID=1095194 RepID=A0A9P6HVE2_9PEZI|nr:uncharacterized protein CkaCkLH20_10791 [Colletotrichum karsti]KAF9871857.1 hypothetical protein CkaCkLH20_10791 [Colletotrichum karsti]
MSIKAFALSILAGTALASPTGLQRRQGSLLVGNSVNGAFREVNITATTSIGNANCKPFSFDGPFVSMMFGMADTTIATLNITDVSGQSHSIAPGTTNANLQGFNLEGNERISKMTLHSGDPTYELFGFDFAIDNGLNSRVRTMKAANADGKTSYELSTGSGIIARVSGSACSDTSAIDGLVISYLDDLASISVSNITYDGFVSNIKDAGKGSSLTVASQMLDNRNSSIQQQILLTTTSATTRSYTITTGSAYTVGASTTVESKVGIPLLSEGKASGTASWSLTESTDEQEMTGETHTQAATFQLNCPARTDCVAAATFLQFKIDVNINVTMTATTKSNEKFNWQSLGKFEGADSLAMKTVVNEVGKA